MLSSTSFFSDILPTGHILGPLNDLFSGALACITPNSALDAIVSLFIPTCIACKFSEVPPSFQRLPRWTFTVISSVTLSVMFAGLKALDHSLDDAPWLEDTLYPLIFVSSKDSLIVTLESLRFSIPIFALLAAWFSEKTAKSTALSLVKFLAKSAALSNLGQHICPDIKKHASDTKLFVGAFTLTLVRLTDPKTLNKVCQNAFSLLLAEKNA